jgi:RNA-binding protein Luc7-like 2
MDAQRALLDALMGLNRDGDRPDDAALDFGHPRVCKAFLCGLCPRDLFQNTKQDAGGACELLHLPKLREAYANEQHGDLGYEQELAKELSRMLAEVEKKIARAQRRLAEDDDQDREKLLKITQDVQDAAAQAANAGDGGSLQMMEKVEMLKRKRRELLRPSSSGAVDVNQQLRVCDVCGAFLSIFDSEQRLADHFGGKVHVGYVQIRSKLKELLQKSKEKEKEQRRSRTRRRERSPDARRTGGRRERARSRSRERQRRRSRSRRSPSSSRSRSRERRRRKHRH